MNSVKFRRTWMVWVILAIFSCELLGDVCHLQVYPHLPQNDVSYIPAVVPVDTWTFFTSGFSDSFGDHFSLRSTLIRFRSLLLLHVLHCSPSSYVLLGQHGRLFYSDLPSVEYYRHLRPMSSDQLHAWVWGLQEISERLKRQQVQFIFVIAPNAATLYPEDLKPWWLRVRFPESKLDQLSSELKRHPTLLFVDPRQALLTEKERSPVYFKTDTHWTSVGAYQAYQGVMKSLSRDRINPISLVSLSVFHPPSEGRSGDLAILTGVPDQFPNELGRWETNSSIPAIHSTIMIIAGKEITFTDNPEAPDPSTLFLVGDSFRYYLTPFFVHTFKKTYSIRSEDLPVSEELIKVIHPNLVVMEMVERNLPTLPALLSPASLTHKGPP